MRTLNALWRLLCMLWHILHGVWIIQRVFPALGQAQRNLRVTAWAQQMLQYMQIRHQVQGTAPTQGPVLLVANHISWLDIVVMHAAGHCRFVSKADIQHWPLVGQLAHGAGTLFIERASRRDAMRVVHDMARSLREGDILAVFPEGTTGDGLSLLPFHANLLQAAISANAPVQPMALRFIDGCSDAPSLAPCYIGDDTLFASVWRTLRARDLVAQLSYGTPQMPQGRDRRTWSADLREEVERLRKVDIAGATHSAKS